MKPQAIAWGFFYWRELNTVVTLVIEIGFLSTKIKLPVKIAKFGVISHCDWLTVNPINSDLAHCD